MTLVHIAEHFGLPRYTSATVRNVCHQLRDKTAFQSDVTVYYKI